MPSVYLPTPVILAFSRLASIPIFIARPIFEEEALQQHAGALSVHRAIHTAAR
jgi:hypothetical protein